MKRFLCIGSVCHYEPQAKNFACVEGRTPTLVQNRILTRNAEHRFNDILNKRERINLRHAYSVILMKRSEVKNLGRDPSQSLL